jgi:long-subunit acyl-CoA synthetase (AMP-forming)
MSNFTSIDESKMTLPNGQLIDTELLEREIKRICHYVHHVVLTLRDGKTLIAIIFPNRSLFTNPDYEKSREEGCFCPRNLHELGKCLAGCMHSINVKLLPGSAKIDSALIINTELQGEDAIGGPGQGINSKMLLPDMNIISGICTVKNYRLPKRYLI